MGRERFLPAYATWDRCDSIGTTRHVGLQFLQRFLDDVWCYLHVHDCSCYYSGVRFRVYIEDG